MALIKFLFWLRENLKQGITEYMVGRKLAEFRSMEEGFRGDDRLKIHLLRSHTSAEDAARIAAQAGVAALAFHHMIPADDPNFGPEDWRAAIAPFWTGRFYLGHDGLTIPLELNHETRNPT